MATPTQQDIIQAVAGLEKEGIALLSDLVRFDSTLGNEGKSAIQAYMEETFSKLGMKVDRFPISLEDIKGLQGFSPVDWSYEGKENVVGVHTPKSKEGTKGKSLIINGHVDVVPTGPSHLWQVTEGNPFNPVVKDGRLYGRGCGDMKAGVASAVLAYRALRSLGVQPASRLLLETVLEEECTGNGALACLAKGYTADAALIPEPFPFIVTAQLGVMWLRLTVVGRPAHVLDTSAGVNAIEAGYKMFENLRQTLEGEWNSVSVLPAEMKGLTHPVNINLGVVHGGEWPSSVPTECNLDVRVGVPPGITLQAARERVEEVLKGKATELGVKHSVTYRGFQAEGCVMDSNWDMMKLLGESHQKVHGEPAKCAPITCTTDARFFNLYHNIPTTCYGPEAQAIHGIDESVSLQSMMDVAKVLALFIADWCGLEPL